MKKICFVLDRSSSMRGIKLDSARKGIRRFVEDLYTNRDRDMMGYIDSYISFISFNDIVQVGLTRRPVIDAIPKLKHALDRITPRGMSALWDAFGAAVREIVEDNGDGDENWIVLLTDGRDNASRKFNLKKLKEYINNTGIEMRMMIIGLGDSVEEFKLRQLSTFFRGQYVKSATDSLSIRSSFAQVSRSINTGHFTPDTEIDSRRAIYGDLEAEELVRLGIKGQVPLETAPEEEETDIFKMTMASLRLDLPEAVLRRNKARQEDCDHDISDVGRSEGVEISGVLNTETHQILYCKHMREGVDKILGACTCDDFRHRGRKLGIPCKHLWMVIGTEGSKLCVEDRLKEDIARVLTGIEGDMGLDAAQAAKIIGLMQDKFAPLVARTRDERPESMDPGQERPADKQTVLENMVLDSLTKRPEGMTLDRLCADMNVRTDKGKKKVRIVLKFLEMKRKVM
ncbi:MAG: vWA domain-containing protein [Candidatus Thermoplasmatota archaeon]|nr:vWA domain-containing protein [Candidatus Thermoplasmatota archaeon]